MRIRPLDLLVIVAMLAFAAISLTYPLGRDQGLFDYVGRGWFLHGEIPYRDAIEHKPPGIFVLHGLLAWALGPHEWNARALDLVLVSIVAVLCVVLSRPRERLATPGALAVSFVATFLLYFGYFGFWDTAQCDFTCMVFAVAGLAALHQIGRERVAHVVGGLLFGLGALVKPTIAILACYGVYRAVRRAAPRRRATLREVVRIGGTIALSAAIPVGALLAYFAAHGALGDMFLWVVRVNGYYLAHERTIETPGEVLEATWNVVVMWYPIAPVVLGLLVVALFVGAREGARERFAKYFGILGFAFATYLGVLVQMKFFRYHSQVLLVPLVLVVLALHEDLHAALSPRVPNGAALAILALLAGLFTIAPESEDNWWRVVRAHADRRAGRISDEAWDAQFDLPGFYDNTNSRRAARWLASRARPGDNVVIRGFEPQIYALSGTRYRHRFFWSNFITVPTRSMLHEEWLAEEEATVRADLPAYALVLDRDDVPVDGAAWFQRIAPYREGARFGRFRILELSR